MCLPSSESSVQGHNISDFVEIYCISCIDVNMNSTVVVVTKHLNYYKIVLYRKKQEALICPN